ncbi:hypothetical protein B0H19DRAFT_1077433 [Mycena capillaripes]|nr:hypothetical protein B0H19DRAFT_1077433 [Mycena capillaripes]
MASVTRHSLLHTPVSVPLQILGVHSRHYPAFTHCEQLPFATKIDAFSASNDLLSHRRVSIPIPAPWSALETRFGMEKYDNAMRVRKSAWKNCIQVTPRLVYKTLARSTGIEYKPLVASYVYLSHPSPFFHPLLKLRPSHCVFHGQCMTSFEGMRDVRDLRWLELAAHKVNGVVLPTCSVHACNGSSHSIGRIHDERERSPIVAPSLIQGITRAEPVWHGYWLGVIPSKSGQYSANTPRIGRILVVRERELKAALCEIFPRG